ncbi:Ig domain-containing protein [Variovorax sp. CY25R-8]|uniref:Ig-like domain-containing protein n=1 Tax=Variovorax sp. CY25R-8 TaxID=2855501 RepID=UPI0021BB25C6|nr:Ig-like domain-containing protein [Variovorax sp. CY25R-8]MCT8179237.1 Ig-like domain-containing protein [Variovorax sp. CY25R-8]
MTSVATMRSPQFQFSLCRRVLRALQIVLASLLLSALGACGGGGGSAGASFVPVTPPATPAPPPTLVAIEVTPVNPALAAGTSVQLAATAIYSDDTHSDVTATAAWTVSDAGVARVDTSGKAVGVGPGSTTVTASLGGQSGSTTLSVTAATVESIALTPATASIAKGTIAQFTATATLSDRTTQNISTQVDWSSSSASVATVDGTGMANGLGMGTATITATCRSATLCPSSPFATAILDVSAAALSSLSVTPATPSIALGTTQQFTATGTYSDQSTQDLTTQVTWGSGDASKATVNALGLATAVGIGATDITATLAGTVATARLTVAPATLASIAVTPSSATASIGGTSGGKTQFTATGTYSDGSTQDITSLVTWASDAPAVATISNAAGSEGLATSVSSGNAAITASSGGLHVSALLTVQPRTVFSAAGSAAWTVPAGVTSIQVVALGGGGGGYSDNNGGNGGQVTATLTVVPGETLTMFVGGGGSPSQAGVGGGGNATFGGAGGGGATRVKRAATDLIIAGGGGGAGASSGGTGGGDGGGHGTASGSPGSGWGNAAGGNNGIGGQGGVGTSSTGGNGDSSAGGSGAQLGGGGGGGFGGGGGGGFNGNYGSGGGGGGSMGPGGATYATGTNGSNLGSALGIGGDGSVTIIY